MIFFILAYVPGNRLWAIRDHGDTRQAGIAGQARKEEKERIAWNWEDTEMKR
jgi:hypothetical protein